MLNYSSWYILVTPGKKGSAEAARAGVKAYAVSNVLALLLSSVSLVENGRLIWCVLWLKSTRGLLPNAGSYHVQPISIVCCGRYALSRICSSEDLHCSPSRVCFLSESVRQLSGIFYLNKVSCQYSLVQPFSGSSRRDVIALGRAFFRVENSHGPLHRHN